MHRFMLAATALLLTLAEARAQDNCAGLSAGNRSFQVIYGAGPSTPAGAPSREIVEQVFREPDGGVRRVRREGDSRLVELTGRYSFVFATRALRGGHDGESSFEGIDTSVDALAHPADHRYVRRVRYADGFAQEAWTRARFRTETVMAVGGCSFRVLVWTIERRLGPGEGHPVELVENLWYAPALRTFLRRQTRRADEPPANDLIAIRIDTRFAPFQ